MFTKTTLLTKVGDPAIDLGNKITIVGCGKVGMAIATVCLAQNITNEVALIDTSEGKAMGEQLDLQHGSLYMNNAKIEAGSDYEITAGSKICIITAGAPRVEGESSTSLVYRNFAVFQAIIPKLAENSPHSIILVVRHPVDILTYVAWKLSKFPKNRVIGSGTSLDSVRFRYLISQRLGISPSMVDGLIIGEQGDSSIPIWSSVNVAGVRLCDLNNKIGTSDDLESWVEVYIDVLKSANVVIRLKGHTNWGYAFCIPPICNAIIKNSGQMFPITTCVHGVHGISRDIFLSLPCVIGSEGVCHIVKQILNSDEEKRFLNSAKNLGVVIDSLVFKE